MGILPQPHCTTIYARLLSGTGVKVTAAGPCAVAPAAWRCWRRSDGLRRASSECIVRRAIALKQRVGLGGDRHAVESTALACIRREPIARSNGYTECTPRLRTDFYARKTAVVERLSAARAVRVEQL